MSPFETASITAAYRSRCEDRVAVLEFGERLILVVADGAGGTSNGAAAAESVLREVAAAASHVRTADEWAQALLQIDLRIADGQSTAVVVDLTPAGLCGASVGDSQAWLIAEGQLENLTARQNRKPLLGTGLAKPVGFAAGSLTGLLLLSTDGFANYVDRAALLAQLLSLIHI